MIIAVTLHCLTILAGMLSAPVAFLILIVFIIFSNLSAVIFWKSKSLSISTWFFISTILGCVEGSYTTLGPILSATVEKKKLKFSETSFASFYMILLFSQRIIFCSPELHFLEKKGLTVVQKKITSFGTSRAAFQKIIFHGFFFQFSNQISFLARHCPSPDKNGRCLINILKNYITWTPLEI